jgi:OOP family OmpA-OmpF porin
MRSSRALGVLAALAVMAGARAASAQVQPEGFAVERFYPSAPGGGWFVMDALDMHGELGGVFSLSASYANGPLRVTDGVQHLTVVSDQAFADLGAAVTYDRLRLYLNFDSPLVVKGASGTVGDYQFTGPAVDPGQNPDTLSDARIGFDARIFGGPRDPLRIGAGAQLLVPNGSRADYDTDNTYRGMLRLLAAGDMGSFTYAAQAGLHLRPLDDSPAPGSPQGSELLFGAAAGARVPVCPRTAFIVGPEVFGESALKSLFGSTTTGLEGLLSARYEGTADDAPQLRIKVGAGGGLDAHFGAPDWRLVFGIEVFDHVRKSQPK